MNLSSESLSLSLLSSGGRYETDKKVFNRLEGNFTYMCCIWLAETHIYSLIWPVDKGNKKSPYLSEM